jgi:hypothetical protein
MFKFIADIAVELDELVNVQLEAEGYNVVMDVLQEVGPGGGWPEVEFSAATREDLLAYADEFGFEDAAEFIEEIN